MDPDYIKSMSIKPHDQTSNQLWLHIQLNHTTNKEALENVAKQLRNKGWLAIYARIVCQHTLMHYLIIDKILGRFSLSKES